MSVARSGQSAADELANIFSLAQAVEIVAPERDMTFMVEQRARMLLRGAMLTVFVLSAVLLASSFHWITIGRSAMLSLGVGSVVTSLFIWLPARWLRRRQMRL